MSEKRQHRRKSAIFVGSIAALSLAISSVVVPAVAAPLLFSGSNSAKGWLGSFTPAGVDSRLAAKYEQRMHAASSLVRFTPAGIDRGSNRTMTIAARSNSPLLANAVSVRNAINAMEQGNGKIRLASTDYRLTAARGWQGFSLPAAAKLPAQKPLSELVGRGDFRLDGETKSKPSRFSTSFSLDPKREAAPPARGTSAAAGDYSVNVGGSFSISRKIDVTAGVRYNSDRDRPISLSGKSDDSEAVYVGTKIRF